MSAAGVITATLLSDGTMLVAGGGARSSVTEAEITTRPGEIGTVTGSLNNARGLHTATLLFDGTVLAAAGNNSSILAGAELFGGPPRFRQTGK
jgi:hypothetical protein